MWRATKYLRKRGGLSCDDCSDDPCVYETPAKYQIKVRLAGCKVREFGGTVKTFFWSPDGKPISVEELEYSPHSRQVHWISSGFIGAEDRDIFLV